MKRFISMLMAILMVVSCMPLSVFAESGAYSLSVDKSEVAVGETVTVTVSLDADAVFNVEGILNASDNLEYVSHEVLASNEFAMLAYNADNGKFAALGNFTGYTGDIALLTITYTAAAAGNADVKLSNAVWTNEAGNSVASANDSVSVEIENEPTICTHPDTKETVVEATCTAEGSKTVTCKDCGTVVSTTVLNIVDHNFVNGVCSMCKLSQNVPAGAGFSISADKSAVNANENVAVTVTLDATAVYNVEGILKTSENLEYVSHEVLAGNEFAQLNLNAANGKFAALGNFTGYTGKINLLTVTYKAVKAGEASVTLSDVLYTDEAGNAVAVDGGSVKVTVQPGDCSHNFEDSEIIKAATCEEAGSKTVKCTLCGATETREIPATGHKEGEEVVVDSTCTEEGSVTTSCTECEEVISSSKLPLADHSINPDSGVCSVCGYKEETEEVIYTLTTDKAEVAVGETVTATIALRGEGVYNVEGILSASSNLEYVSHEILAGNEFSQLAWNKANGKFAALGNFTGFDGEITLLTVTYKAVEAGKATILLSNTIYTNEAGAAVSVKGGSATVDVIATDEIVVSISNATAAVGEEVTLDVSIANNTVGFISGKVKLQYDAEALEPIAMAGNMFEGSLNVAKAIANHASDSPVVGDGVLFTVTFKVLKAGENTVTAAVSGMRDDAGNVLAVATTAGTVSVRAEEAVCEHTNTNVVNAKEATCCTVGYTGDKVCADCGETIEVGKKIEATGEHTYDDDCKEVKPIENAEYTLSTDKAEVAVGETVTATIALKGEGVYNVEGILNASSNLEYVSHEILAGNEFSQLAWNKANGKFAALGNFTGFDGEITLLTVTYKAVEAGKATILLSNTIYTNEAGAAVPVKGGSATVDIKEAECLHTEVTYEANGKSGTHKVICTKCGVVLDADAPCEGAKKDIVEPTCTKEGSETHYCVKCGMYIVYAIPAKGHVEVVVAGKEATCTETGLTEGKQCSVCDEVLVAQDVIPVKDHIWSDLLTDQEPTCTEMGSCYVECTVCGKKRGNNIDPLGHEEVVIAGEEPTCNEDGLTEGKNCSRCGEVFVAQEVIPATGVHEFVDGKCSCGTIGGKLNLGIEWIINEEDGTYEIIIRGEGAMPDFTEGNRPWEAYIALLNRVFFGSGITHVGNYSFYNSTVEEINFEDASTFSVRRSANGVSIGNNAFGSCTELKEINLPNTVTEIQESAFENCSNVSAITMAAVEVIKENAFKGCAAVEEVVLPETTTSIGSGAFAECASLKEVTIPASVTAETMGDNVFAGSDVSKVSYKGSAEAWTEITETTGNETLKDIEVTLQPEEPEVLLGDVDGDGEIKGKDIVKMRDYLMERIELTDVEFKNADVTKDGEVTGRDIVRLRDYLMERISEF